MPDAALQLLDLALVDDHPDNPRLCDRQEVIDGIAASLGESGEFPRQHALRVRPRPEGRFQLLAGHHRKKAALNAGLSKVWAWVEDLDDEQALMALVLDNRQGELSPLEVGIHVLKAVPPEGGGRGKTGGLSEYARRVGKTQGYVSQLRAAAEVAEAAKPITQVIGLADRAKHLFEIHSAPREVWPALVQAFLALPPPDDDSKGDPWTVARTAEAVRSLRGCLKTTAGPWAEICFRPTDVAAEVVLSRAKPAKFVNVVRLVAHVHDLIRDNEPVLPEGALAVYHEWLAANARGLSWDMPGLRKYEADVYELIAGATPAGLFDLILADPPWRYDFAETDSRQVENQYPTMTGEEIEALDPRGAPDSVLFLWATAPKLREALAVMEAWGFEYKTHAVWDKEVIGMGYWFRGRHELLLVGTKGDFSPPGPAARVPSVISAPRGKHSEKPEEVYAVLESMFPEAKRLEMFARGKRDGWHCEGYEAGKDAEAKPA